MYEIPWTFKSWIANFKGVDLPIGDLAKDILEDPDFPEDDDFGEIFDHLRSKRVHYTVLNIFLDVWQFYRASI